MRRWDFFFERMSFFILERHRDWDSSVKFSTRFCAFKPPSRLRFCFNLWTRCFTRLSWFLSTEWWILQSRTRVFLWPWFWGGAVGDAFGKKPCWKRGGMSKPPWKRRLPGFYAFYRSRTWNSQLLVEVSRNWKILESHMGQRPRIRTESCRWIGGVALILSFLSLSLLASKRLGIYSKDRSLWKQWYRQINQMALTTRPLLYRGRARAR